MLNSYMVNAVLDRMRNATIYLQVTLLIIAGFVPLMSFESADAAQITSRKVAISTSEPEKTGVNYNFTFSYPASNVQGAVLEFCRTPLGDCDLPGTNTASTSDSDDYTTERPMSLASATLVSNTLPGSGGTAVTTNTGLCSDVTGAERTMFCFTKTGSSAAGTDVTVNLSNIANPGLPNTGGAVTSNNVSIYVRISLFSDTTFTSGGLLHKGTVATSVNQLLTVSGRVQERLNFCVGAVTDAGAVDPEFPANVSACGALTNPVVDLGVIDNSAIAKSPVANSPPSLLGNAKYGIAMINTNASGGATVNYFVEPDATGTQKTRAFRVPGATCDASTTSLTDQCFESKLTKGGAISAGAEEFGMNIACLIQNKTTTSLAVAADYSGTATSAAQPSDANCENVNTGAYYVWNTGGTSVNLASSTSVIDDEVIKLNFAATASATTPTGSYTVRSTYIATPTF